MLLQTNLFYEDEIQDTVEIYRKVFPNLKTISEEEVYRIYKPEYTYPFRGSLALAARLSRNYDWSNALKWLPALSQWYGNDNYIFLDMAAISRRKNDIDWPIFIKPCSGFKQFAGNLYTQESWANEEAFAIQNKNIDPATICLLTTPLQIWNEYRTVFVNGNFISGCQYMEDSELKVRSHLPIQVERKAEEIARHPYFINLFNFVIDLGVLENGKIFLIEINGLETSSWYGCDIEKILNAWLLTEGN